MGREASRRPSERAAWIAVLAAALALAAAAGVRNALGLFFHPWEAEFGWNRSAVSLVASTGLLVYGVGQATAGRCADRFTPRLVFVTGMGLLGVATLLLGRIQSLWQVYVVFGCLIMAAVGGASSVTGSVVVARWRLRRAALGIAVVMAGGTIGQIVLVPLVAWLMARMGWRQSLTIVGSGVLVVLLPVVWELLRDPAPGAPAPRATRPAEDGGRRPLGEVLRQGNFWLLALTFWVCGFTTAGLIETHLIPYAEDIHIDAVTAAQSMGVFGVFNLLGVLAAGAVADRLGYKQTLAWIYGVRALILVFLLFVRDPAGLFVFAAAFGALDFATVPPTSTLSGVLLGRASAGTVFGLVTLSHQVGSALGAYAGGFAHDVLGSYGAAFVVAAILSVVASGLAAMITRQPARAPTRSTA